LAIQYFDPYGKLDLKKLALAIASLTTLIFSSSNGDVAPPGKLNIKNLKIPVL